ncbi:transporter substrate-binding domain-containing protein [Methylophilus sp. VKM B-3414]|uniref:transporter substrate-binding domain-containing protein n=1 Tax=Methylophilus sp. VKM B-3414 TaxID=3076121 RepID=UPI0028C7F526|nr:transporter substrate-binding domain-containing protein [Methylophilus sp. VKM B-3414]MDT7849727.1 transporter substrate-binding domain-containing protein [Methylophilus sp. VKM B-3414]
MQDHSIKVGVLYSQTGVVSAIGNSQLQGTLLAIDEVNAAGGVNGRMIVPISYDTQSNPDLDAAFAEKLILEDKVKVIFGGYTSISRRAILPVVEKWNRLLFYPTMYEGFEFSNNVIYTGATPNQNIVQLVEYMTSNYGTRVYLVGSDYIFPYESNRIMKELLTQYEDGEVLGEVYLKLNASEDEFLPIIEDIKEKKPDFIFSTVVGETTAYLYKHYAQAGLNPQQMPIASLSTSEAEIAQMGAEAAVGHFTSSPYFQSVDSQVNRECLTNFRKKFGHGAIPNMNWEAAYFQVHLFANAMAQSNDDDIEALLPYLLDSAFNAPQGLISIDPLSHHTNLNPRIGRANADGQFTIVRESSNQVYADPYLVTHTFEDVRLVSGRLGM